MIRVWRVSSPERCEARAFFLSAPWKRAGQVVEFASTGESRFNSAWR